MIAENLEILVVNGIVYVQDGDRREFHLSSGLKNEGILVDADRSYDKGDHERALKGYEEVFKINGLLLASRVCVLDGGCIANCYGLIAMKAVNEERFDDAVSNSRSELEVVANYGEALHRASNQNLWSDKIKPRVREVAEYATIARVRCGSHYFKQQKGQVRELDERHYRAMAQISKGLEILDLLLRFSSVNLLSLYTIAETLAVVGDKLELLSCKEPEVFEYRQKLYSSALVYLESMRSMAKGQEAADLDGILATPELLKELRKKLLGNSIAVLA